MGFNEGYHLGNLLDSFTPAFLLPEKKIQSQKGNSDGYKYFFCHWQSSTVDGMILPKGPPYVKTSSGGKAGIDLSSWNGYISIA